MTSTLLALKSLLIAEGFRVNLFTLANGLYIPHEPMEFVPARCWDSDCLIAIQAISGRRIDVGMRGDTLIAVLDAEIPHSYGSEYPLNHITDIEACLEGRWRNALS